MKSAVSSMYIWYSRTIFLAFPQKKTFFFLGFSNLGKFFHFCHLSPSFDFQYPLFAGNNTMMHSFESSMDGFELRRCSFEIVEKGRGNFILKAEYELKLQKLNNCYIFQFTFSVFEKWFSFSSWSLICFNYKLPQQASEEGGSILLAFPSYMYSGASYPH